MKFIKNIFARIWALWGLISFVVTFLIFFLPSMTSHFIADAKKSQEFFIYISKIWMNVWLTLVGCPVKIFGLEHFQPNENYVVVFNHNAFLDVPLSAPFVPGANKTIAKDSFVKVPIFGSFYRKGAVLVNRKDEKSRIKSLEAMKNVLKLGMHMCIYPEGTRNRTDQPLKAFYDGAFKLAIDANKEIMPCVIVGTKTAMPIDKFFYLLPTKLKMIFLPPVKNDEQNAKLLKEEVFEKMLTVYCTEMNIKK